MANAYLEALKAARDAGRVDTQGKVYDESMMPWDFAVIEFGAGARPAPMVSVGWNGFAVNGFSEGTAKIYGYPGGSGCPHTNDSQRLCGTSGAAYTNGSYLETREIDASPGQSGGPWLRSSNHMVGINTAEVVYYDLWRCGGWCVRNMARRLDGVVWGWIQTWSPDW